MKIKFTKMVASGNDFVVVESLPSGLPLPSLARKICDRRFGVGADGLLILKQTSPGVIRMRIFNSDGSEAQMCGNGARSAAIYATKKDIKIMTLAGIIEAKVNASTARIKLPEPKNIKLDIPIKVSARKLAVNFINTGVPHTIIFVAQIDKINVKDIGNQVRYHKKFFPAGANVDFVEVLSRDSLNIRTYERGVEDETLACGTGSVASALVFALKTGISGKVNVHTKGGEILKVSFKKDNNQFSDIWLEGRVEVVYKGEYHV